MALLSSEGRIRVTLRFGMTKKKGSALVLFFKKSRVEVREVKFSVSFNKWSLTFY